MKMKQPISLHAHQVLLAVIFLLVLTLGESLRSTPDVAAERIHTVAKDGEDKELGMPFFPAGGSSLPDCSHACGPCFPCKRVTVSFKCSVGDSCPIVYRCMCKGKYYHIPSN